MLNTLRASRAVQGLAGAALPLTALVGSVAWQLGAERRALEAARARWLAAPAGRPVRRLSSYNQAPATS